MENTYSPLYLQNHGNQVKPLVTGKMEILHHFKKENFSFFLERRTLGTRDPSASLLRFLLCLGIGRIAVSRVE